LQDVANINVDLRECDRRCILVKAMLQRRAEDAEEASEELRGRATSTAPAHPLLVAAKERITEQLRELHANNEKLSVRRDTLLMMSEVCFRSSKQSFRIGALQVSEVHQPSTAIASLIAVKERITGSSKSCTQTVKRLSACRIAHDV
jgi:hypothetical protein